MRPCPAPSQLSGVASSGRRLASASVVAVLVVSCVTQPEAGAPDEAGSTTVVDEETSSTTTSTTEPSSSPTTGPSTTLTEEGIRQQTDELLGQYAFPPDGPHPTGSVEFMEWLAFCEGAFGFEMEVVAEPGQDPYLYGQVMPDQDELHSRVRSACRTAAVDAGFFFPLARTEEFGQRVYAGFMAVHQCMVSQGFPVTDPPSEETFVADWVTGRGYWHPYDATPFGGSLSVSPDAEGDPPSQVSAQLEIQETCPADWATVLGDSIPDAP